MVEASAEIPHQAGFDPASRGTTRGAKKDKLSRSVTNKPQRDFSSQHKVCGSGRGCFRVMSGPRYVIQT
jgi:hypothetical protein